MKKIILKKNDYTHKAIKIQVLCTMSAIKAFLPNIVNPSILHRKFYKNVEMKKYLRPAFTSS